jgi:disulfide bond formation protein DsbB
MKFITNRMKNILKNDFHILIIFSLIAIFPLCVVSILEYFFNVLPCKLCVYERLPLLIISIMPVIFYFFKNHTFKGFLVILAAITFNAALSFYHLGVENKWFINSTCNGFNESSGNTIENFFLSSSTLFQQCDVVKFRFLGISLAGWDFIYCILFFVVINVFILKKI